MRIRFLGTGTAFNTDGRMAQAIHVEPGSGGPFLVDAGPDTMVAVNRFRVDIGAVDRVFITHLHGDHTVGWPFLLLHMTFVEERTRTLHVHGPTGTAECLEGLMRLCYPEIVPKQKFEVRFHELPVAPAEGLPAGDGLVFDVVPVVHHPTSIGYRFHAGGTTLAVSGDTGWCPGVERLATGADALILECTTVEATPMAHMSLAEVRAQRERLAASVVILNHLPDAVAEALALDPVRGVISAHDGLVFDVEGGVGQ